MMRRILFESRNPVESFDPDSRPAGRAGRPTPAEPRSAHLPASFSALAVDSIRRTRSIRSERLIACTLIACATILGGCAARTPQSYRLVPTPAPDYSIEGSSVTIKTQSFRLTVIPLDDLARTAFIRSRAEGATDPFGPDRNGVVKYLSFRLSVENLDDKQPVVFQPQSIYLASESGDRLFPMDYPEAYSRLVVSMSSDPRLLDDLSKYLFDTGVSVSPGERVEGLLVYPTVKQTAKKIRMEFNFLQTGGTSSNNYDIFFTKEPRS